MERGQALNLAAYLSRRQRLIERALQSHFPAVGEQGRRIDDAIRYTLLGGGKRLRPVLMFASVEAVGGDARSVLAFACAVEMIHAYSLIHDDLPAMDNDAMRRGKPSNHLTFGEGMAILAGDGLLTDAFRVMAESAAVAPSPRRAVRAMREIAEAAGPRGMVGGQAADLQAEGTTPNLATVEYIHVRKTGALILASVRAGALLAGASARQLRRLTLYGEFVGVAFQVADDILDAEAPSSQTGKEEGRDQTRQKATFPAVMGLPAAKERAREMLDRALEEIEDFPKAADPLRAIARFIVGRACGRPR